MPGMQDAALRHGPGRTISGAQEKVSKNMNRFLNSVGQVFTTIGAATRAANAVRAHRAPDALTLRQLGIDPEAFRGIRL